VAFRRKTQPDPDARAEPISQDWLPVADIQQGCLIRPDGGVVAGLSIRPYSLALKSERERGAIIQAFQAALNGVPCPYQIVALPRPVDLDSYLAALDQLQGEVDSRRRAVLRDYLSWVTALVRAGDATERRYALLLTRTGPDAIAEHQAMLRGLLDDLARIRGLEAAPLTDADWRELLFLVFHGDRAAQETVPDGVPRWAPLYHGGDSA
jgi:hypothetical protein